MTANPTPTPLGSTVLGYPRIGPNRELKKALEGYWAGRTGEQELRDVRWRLRAETWQQLRDVGLDSVPGNTFSFYDHVLDTTSMFGALPERFRRLELSPLDTYFAMARGAESTSPLELTKWFDTNYHYLVPEIGPDTQFSLADTKPVDEYREARELGIETRPVILGPASFLLLSKPAANATGGFRPLDLLDSLVDRYAELLSRLRDAGAEWVQLDEPAFAADRSQAELAALRRAYDRLGESADRPALLVAGYYGDLGPALPELAAAPVEGIALDLVAGPESVDQLPRGGSLGHKTVVAGVVDGRNVWRTDVDAALAVCAPLQRVAGEVAVGTSCPLLHVPYDVDAETSLDPRLRSWLAFARQKVDEVVVVSRALHSGRDAVAAQLAEARAAVDDRIGASELRNDQVRARLESIGPEHFERSPYPQRARLQQQRLDLPQLPTTTIGSFPQTADIRSTRAAHRSGKIDDAEYRSRMRAEIEGVVRLQEALGLDVLVHGEPERNDMVQYFAEQLDGFLSTENGWVQSFGPQCVRPPILYGDVSRPEPMTVGWTTDAQSLTSKPVKGMLTGPVTMLAWSFVRDDQPLADTARQVALAIRDEIGDLESADTRIVQVDEPALRELLPLRGAHREEYLEWAVEAFRLATSGVSDGTRVHTHMCYAEFGDVLGAIDAMDADVIYIEAARSRMEVLDDLDKTGFARGVGPGVYDIHSPRVAGTDEMADLLRAALESLPAERLWVNPDCGLKTRDYAEVEPALRNMVVAAERVRAELASGS